LRSFTGVAAAKAGEKLESAEAGLLRDIFGIAFVASKPAREIVSGVEVRQHDEFELALISTIQGVWKMAMK
jgi:hypothetical protein